MRENFLVRQIRRISLLAKGILSEEKFWLYQSDGKILLQEKDLPQETKFYCCKAFWYTSAEFSQRHRIKITFPIKKKKLLSLTSSVKSDSTLSTFFCLMARGQIGRFISQSGIYGWKDLKNDSNKFLYLYTLIQ